MLREALIEALTSFGGEVREEGGTIAFTKVLAERRVFLARRRLVYRAVVRVDEGKREVHVRETLTETGSGLALESGAGFKAESYRTRPGAREGTIAEQAELFGKKYSYTFDFAAVRAALEVAARNHGCTVHPRFSL
ncbi:MAG: hypothetical protein N2320_06670 [Candidatus Bipolaricaulota bacterium]|nr:hypothetical protein [Candidatus Bipolaricaulota bacterium]